MSDFRVVIVTGCSSGIGLELVSLLHSEGGYRVVACVREAWLEPMRKQFPENANFVWHELDLTKSFHVPALIHDISARWGRIDVLVNNAAVCFRAVVEHMDPESEELQLKTNYLGPMELTRAVLPIMREQRSGHIINVSSVSGMVAMPTMGSYSASKHALDAATEALWYEARPLGISINLVQLGFVNSNSFRRVQLSKKAAISLAVGGPHSEYYQSMTPMIEQLMAVSLLSSSAIAKRILNLIHRPASRLLVAMTPDAVVFSILKKLIPSFIFHRLLYWLLPGSVKWGGRWKANKGTQEREAA